MSQPPDPVQGPPPVDPRATRDVVIVAFAAFLLIGWHALLIPSLIRQIQGTFVIDDPGRRPVREVVPHLVRRDHPGRCDGLPDTKTTRIPGLEPRRRIGRGGGRYWARTSDLTDVNRAL